MKHLPYSRACLDRIDMVVTMQHDFVPHIGSSKTGTSAIQTFIRRNVDIFEACGFIVPDANLGFSGQITGVQVSAFQTTLTPPTSTASPAHLMG